MEKEKKCVAGCRQMGRYEWYHMPHCPFYPNSMSESYDKLKLELKILNEELVKRAKKTKTCHNLAGECDFQCTKCIHWYE